MPDHAIGTPLFAAIGAALAARGDDDLSRAEWLEQLGLEPGELLAAMQEVGEILADHEIARGTAQSDIALFMWGIAIGQQMAVRRRSNEAQMLRNERD